MKFLLLFITVFGATLSANAAVSAVVPVTKTVTTKTAPVVKVLTKVPKSLFLTKRAKVDSNVGEPSIYTFDRQLRTITYDSAFKFKSF